MAIDENALHDLAQEFIHAENHRQTVEPVSSRFPNLAQTDAYRIQQEIVSSKIRRGDRVIGFKVGATSAAIQKALGIDEPAYGCLLKSHEVACGGTISTSRLIQPRVECEIAFVLGRDLVGPGVDVAKVLEATEVVMASLEILDCRTREWKVDIRDTIADNGVTAHFVLGDDRLKASGLDLPAIEVVLKKNGEQIAIAQGNAVLGNPAQAVAWLANRLAQDNRGLGAGEVILPGSLTTLVPVVSGDRIEATFNELGDVWVDFQ